MVKPLTIIAGAGAGLGAAIAQRFAKAYTVVLLARNPDNLQQIAGEVSRAGGDALPISTDLLDPSSVDSAFARIRGTHPVAPLAVAVFNSPGGFLRKPFLELTEQEFSSGWEGQGKAGFLFAQHALPLLLQNTSKPTSACGAPSLIFTGATASLKGSAGFSAFAAGKFALRALAQSLAREFGPKGVHVAHVVADGIVAGPRMSHLELETEDAKMDPTAIAEIYWHLHTQPRSTFSFEIDARPFAERW